MDQWLRAKARKVSNDAAEDRRVTAELVDKLRAYVDVKRGKRRVGVRQARELLETIEGHDPWLAMLIPKRTGPQGWEPPGHLVAELSARTKDVDTIVACVIVGLGKPDDYESIVLQGKRNKKPPTLAEGIRVHRKRVQKVLGTLKKK